MNCSPDILVIANATGPRGPIGPSGVGLTKFTAGTYPIANGISFVMFDLTSQSGVLQLATLDSDAFICVKDYLAHASGTRTISALGTVDGISNPVLVNIARGWAWLRFTKTDADGNVVNLWSLGG